MTSSKRILTTPLGIQIELTPRRPLKRGLDFTFALIGIIIVSPLLLVTALIVKLTSKGPVFYVSPRVGRGGRAYQMIKFRSMKPGAPPVCTADGKLVVVQKDPRVTFIGKIIRATKIDELPQLFNVLRGDMALVGPRSGLPEYEKTYSDIAYERLRVRPGVTGLGSVLGARHLSNECLYKIEACYVARQSFSLDMLCLLCTPLYIAFGPKITRRILGKYVHGIDFQNLEGVSAES